MINDYNFILKETEVDELSGNREQVCSHCGKQSSGPVATEWKTTQSLEKTPKGFLKRLQT